MTNYNPTDHADASVLEEPTIPNPSTITITPDWAQHLTLANIDAVATDWIEDQKAWKRQYANIGFDPTRGKEPPTDIALAIAILRWLEDRALAPTGAKWSWACVESLRMSDWIYDRFKEHGLKFIRRA